MTTDTHSLITRLESLTEPSREVDALVHQASQPELADMSTGCAPGWLTGGEHKFLIKVPEYTASIDAALTLVPEGWFVHECGQISPRDDSNWYCILARPSAGISQSNHKSFPVALCIASLKATRENERG